MKLLPVFVFMTMMFSVSAECNPPCYRGVCNDQKCICHTGWEGADCKTFESCPMTKTTYACSKNEDCRFIDRDMQRSEPICCDSKCVEPMILKRGFACNESDPCSGECEFGKCIENICQDRERDAGCPCTKDDDCSNSLAGSDSRDFCLNKKCREKYNVGATCTANNECSSNTCENEICKGGATCRDSYGLRCSALEVCDYSNGACVPLKDVGGECKEDRHCYNDLYCHDYVNTGTGTCVAKIPSGQTKNINGTVHASSCLSGTGEAKHISSGMTTTTQLTCRQKCCTTDSECMGYNTMAASSCVKGKCSVVTASQVRSGTPDVFNLGASFTAVGKFYPKCSKIFATIGTLFSKYGDTNTPDSLFDAPADEQKVYAEYMCCNICLYPESMYARLHPHIVLDCSTNSIRPNPNTENACSFSQKAEGPDAKSTCPVEGYVPPSQPGGDPIDDGGCGAPVVGFVLKAIPIFVLFLNF